MAGAVDDHRQNDKLARSWFAFTRVREIELNWKTYNCDENVFFLFSFCKTANKSITIKHLKQPHDDSSVVTV